MVYINNQMYLERTTKGGKRNPHGKCTVRNWWLVKPSTAGGTSIDVGKISFPSRLFGKRVRIKVEVMEDKELKSGGE